MQPETARDTAPGVAELRDQIAGVLREWQTEPYGDVRLNADRIAAKAAALVQPVIDRWERLAALMDPRGADQIEQIQAERDAMPKEERDRLEAADAPLLRIQLAGMVRERDKAKAELDETAEAAAKDIWVKMGFDTILHWKDRAEQAERERDEARRHRDQAENRSALYREQVRTEHDRADQAEAAIGRARLLPTTWTLRSGFTHDPGIAVCAHELRAALGKPFTDREWTAALSQAGGSEGEESK